MEETNQSSADIPGEPTEIDSASAPIESAELNTKAPAEPSIKWGLNRRKFLTAAALGSAAAMMLNEGGGRLLRLGPATALANDLSGKPCTAEDVEIIGTGIVLNEPCSCAPGGKFNAQVQFTVRNNTSAARYCIALHLVDTTAGGVTIAGQDVILRRVSDNKSQADGKSGGESFHDTVMVGVITDFPCSAGLVCFGQAGVTQGKCAANTCTTIAWNTSQTAAGCTTADQNPPGGQCRHQQVCVQGFGATLVCKSGCTPSCGGTAVLTASVSGGKSPYVYVLTGTDGTSQTFPASGTTTATSHDFSVTVTQNTTYTVTTTDSSGCSRSASLQLTATPISVSISVSGDKNCDGKLKFKATVTGGSGCSFAWKVDGASAGSNSDTLNYDPTLDGTDHTVSVDVDCGGCTANASKKVNQCVSTTVS